MTGPRAWLVRHGQTSWSAAGRHTSHTDVPLTETGEGEAKELEPLLSGRQFALVETSPRVRARRTAQLAGFDPIEDQDLVEWDYGELEGLTAEQVRALYPAWAIWHGPWPGGEQPEHVAARARQVVERVRGLPGTADALLFSHGHFLRVLATAWLGRPPEDGRMLALATGTVSVLGWEHGQPVIEHWSVPPPGRPGEAWLP